MGNLERGKNRGGGAHSVEAGAEDPNRESVQKVVLGQELGSSSVEGGERTGQTGPSTGLVESGALRKLAGHEE